MSSSSADFMSFYIPYVPKHWDEDSIRRLFADLRIGLVDRVDFFDAGNWSQGGNCAWAFGAFVHLKSWVYSDYADWVYDGIQNDGQFTLHIPNQPGKYFVLRKMTCPKIPSTHLNVHQLAAKMTEMEQELQMLRNETQLLKAGAIATLVAEEALRENSSVPLEVDEPTPDFYASYDATTPLSLRELADQTQEFDKMGYNYSGVPMDVDSDISSVGSAADRMRVSEELCGNN
jgi:hypothetical protein